MKIAYDIFGEELMRDLYDTVYNKFRGNSIFSLLKNRVSYMLALKRKEDFIHKELDTWSTDYEIIYLLDLPLKCMPLLVNHPNIQMKEIVAWRLKVGR